MLRRVISIKNVGKFRNSAATPNPELTKHVLVFAANGYGKTTFCTVIRSVQSGDVAPVLGRRTLGAADDPHIDLLFADGNRRLKDGRWSATAPNISVFDGTFVAENVHSGDVVDLDNKRNLYRVIIGRDGVALAEEERRLTEAGRETQAELTATEKVVQQLCRGMSIADFLSLCADEQIDTKIEAQKQTINALREAEAIAARSPLLPLPLPPKFDFEPLLAKTLQTLSDDAEAHLMKHLARHGMTDSGRQWLAEGMNYVAEDECPFCGRDDLEKLPLIKAYKVAFDKAFRDLKKDIEDSRAAIEESLGAAAQEKLRTLKAQNEASIEYWRRYCEIADLPDVENAVVGIAKAHQEIAELIKRKANQPHIGIERKEGLSDLNEASVALGLYNKAIEMANAAIAERKKATEQGDLEKAQARLDKLETTKRRYEASSVEACDRLVRLRKAKKEIETAKADVRKKLEAHSRRVIQPYEKQINHYLEMFNAGFRIVRTAHHYPGGIATSTYQLLIDDHYVNLGDAKTPSDKPSFKNTLSAGDRTTLGLAIFLAQLDAEENLDDRIVVFDDPFSSQDAFRRRQTIYEIMRVAGRAAQVIVLSHDAHFLKQLWEKCPSDQRSAVQINLGPGGSKIAAFDLGAACRGRAAAELDDLMAFRNTGAGDLREIIKKLRVVLETHFRSNYPGAFDANDNLGDMLAKIRSGGELHPAAEHYETLDRINDYTADYHHGEDPGDAAEPALDYVELQGFVALTLRIVNALPS
jgi:wobble nucleotide-excising tRNase